MNLTKNYKEFLNIIKNEFIEVMEENVSYYQGYDVVMSLEQEFIKQKNLAPNKLHFVVKFSSATVNYGQTILPVTITAMSEQNHCDVCQDLLFSFVQKFNLERLEENKVQQIYESPVVTSNFNKIYTGYSSILFVKGFFVISENANFFTYHVPILTVESPEDDLFLVDKSKFLRKIKDDIFDIEQCMFYPAGGEFIMEKILKNGENKIIAINSDDYGVKKTNGTIKIDVKEIPTLSQGFSGEVVPDSQPFFNTNDMTRSIGKYGTRTINLSSFLLNNIEIVNECLKLMFSKNGISVNNSFFIAIKFTNMFDISEYKLVNISGVQNLGEIPTIALTFAI